MFTIDGRLKGIPATREQVFALHKSLNAPYLAVPDKKAGPAQAYIVGLRISTGLAIFVYLYLADGADCAVYVPSRRNLTAAEVPDEENEALGFVESMGFMMDNMNFRSLAVDAQEQLIRTLPVFQKEPKGGAPQAPAKAAVASPKEAAPTPEPAAPAAPKNLDTGALGKLFGSFCLVALLGFAGCRHTPDEKALQNAQIHYDLGVQAQQSNPQMALQEFQKALDLDPNFVEAHNAMAVLLHLSFNRPDEAIEHYRKAILLRPAFSEAKTNLGNVFLDQKRYDEAIKLYEEALNDMLYPTPFIAQGNLGWALYKKGEVKRGIDHIKASVTTNPKFCLGYRNLGIIYDEQGEVEESCLQLGRYRERCPDLADAYFREGICLAKTGKSVAARTNFETCEAKASTDAMKDDCRRLKDKLSP